MTFKEGILGWHRVCKIVLLSRTLSAKCPTPGCKNVISTDLLNHSPCKRVGFGEMQEVECPRCFNVFDQIPKKTRGDPWNLASDDMHYFEKKKKEKKNTLKANIQDMTIELQDCETALSNFLHDDCSLFDFWLALIKILWFPSKFAEKLKCCVFHIIVVFKWLSAVQLQMLH